MSGPDPELRRLQEKAYRERHHALGLCLKCTNKHASWSVYCEQCLIKRRAREQRRRRKLGIPEREPAQKHFYPDDRAGLARMKLANEKRYQKKKRAKGICIVCTEPAEPDRIKCRKHLDMCKAYSQNWRKKQRKAHTSTSPDASRSSPPHA